MPYIPSVMITAPGPPVALPQMLPRVVPLPDVLTVNA
jgi:hypothetical protein